MNDAHIPNPAWCTYITVFCQSQDLRAGVAYAMQMDKESFQSIVFQSYFSKEDFLVSFPLRFKTKTNWDFLFSFSALLNRLFFCCCFSFFTILLSFSFSSMLPSFPFLNISIWYVLACIYVWEFWITKSYKFIDKYLEVENNLYISSLMFFTWIYVLLVSISSTNHFLSRYLFYNSSFTFSLLLLLLYIIIQNIIYFSISSYYTFFFILLSVLLVFTFDFLSHFFLFLLWLRKQYS